MANLSLTERISRTGRRQKRLLEAVPGLSRDLDEDLDAPSNTKDNATLRSIEHIDLLSEFNALLPVATRLYGYGETDIEFIKTSVSNQWAGVTQELKATIRQWRIDCVTAGLDGYINPGDQKPLMGELLARRARIQFRQDVLREAEDENGQPYTDGLLDWAPEPTVWTIPKSFCDGVVSLAEARASTGPAMTAETTKPIQIAAPKKIKKAAKR